MFSFKSDIDKAKEYLSSGTRRQFLEETSFEIGALNLSIMEKDNSFVIHLESFSIIYESDPIKFSKDSSMESILVEIKSYLENDFNLYVVLDNEDWNNFSEFSASMEDKQEIIKAFKVDDDGLSLTEYIERIKKERSDNF